MNENTKILVLAALVLVVAIVSFNLNITGKVTDCNDNTRIIISPTTLTFDRYDTAKSIVVSFEGIDSRGLDRDIDLYKENGARVETNFMRICSDYQCREDVTKSETLSVRYKGDTYYLQATRTNDGCVYTSNKFTLN